MKPTILTLMLALALSSPACLIDNGHNDCYGDDCHVDSANFGFWWEFELGDGSLTDSCLRADVSRVDVRIYDEYGDLEYAVLDRPCGDMGLDLFDFYPGWYEIQLKARCGSGAYTHESWYDLWADAGENDFGVLTLDYLGPCF
jgi:hypothetical protein